MKTASLVAIIFLVVVAIMHLLRLVLHVEVKVGSMIVPMWISIFAFVFTCGLAIMLWLEYRRK
jgi:hypothetical protein